MTSLSLTIILFYILIVSFSYKNEYFKSSIEDMIFKELRICKLEFINLNKDSDSYHAIGQSIWKIGRWKIRWPWSKCKTWNEKRIRLKNNSLNSFVCWFPQNLSVNICYYSGRIGECILCLQTFVYILSKLFVDVNFTHTLDWFLKVWIEWLLIYVKAIFREHIQQKLLIQVV